jgi:hypothetical protein
MLAEGSHNIFYSTRSINSVLNLHSFNILDIFYFGNLIVWPWKVSYFDVLKLKEKEKRVVYFPRSKQNEKTAF